jgi:hypothetical protein
LPKTINVVVNVAHVRQTLTIYSKYKRLN